MPKFLIFVIDNLITSLSPPASSVKSFIVKCKFPAWQTDIDTLIIRQLVKLGSLSKPKAWECTWLEWFVASTYPLVWYDVVWRWILWSGVAVLADEYFSLLWSVAERLIIWGESMYWRPTSDDVFYSRTFWSIRTNTPARPKGSYNSIPPVVLTLRYFFYHMCRYICILYILCCDRDVKLANGIRSSSPNTRNIPFQLVGIQ